MCLTKRGGDRVQPIDLNPRHLQTVKDILRAYVPDQDVSAFGSRVRWTARATSDLDLVIMTDEPLPSRRIAMLSSAFSDSDLPIRVDVVDWSAITPGFRKAIRDEMVLLKPRESGLQGLPPEKLTKTSWRRVRASDLVREGSLRIDDGYRVTNRQLGDKGIPFVRGGDIGDGDINVEVDDHILPKYRDLVKSKLAVAGDVAFITKGTVGRAGYLRADQPEVVFAPQVSYWRSLAHDALDPRFLFYLIRGPEFSANLNAVKTHGSMAADYVSLKDQLDFWLTIPPAEEQRRISFVLASLDEKIHANKMMNRTLEAIARTLFRSWFVDFDPVRAKMEGRPTGLPDDVAALFPDRLVDSPLGPVPEGWKAATLADVADLNAKSLGKDYPHETVQYVEISGVGAGSVRELSTYPLSEAPSRARRLVQHGDTVLSTVRPDRRNFFLAFNPPANLLVSTGFVTLTPKDLPWAWLYLAATAPENFEELGRLADGGAYPAVRPDVVGQLPAVVPSRDVAKAFAEIAEPLLGRYYANVEQSRTLAELRDTLLPKLLSGEIRIPTDPPEAPA